MAAQLWSEYVIAGLKHNTQVLPETLVAGTALLGILLSNHALLALALAAFCNHLLGLGIGRTVMKFDSANAILRSASDPCNDNYVGRTWSKLLNGVISPDFLWHPVAPSLYMMTVAFFFGWSLGLQLLYKEEIDAGILKKSYQASMTVISLLLVALLLIARVKSGCDTTIGALIGGALGCIFGFGACVAIGSATARRLTNIWGMPLLRDRINDGSPVYVCPPSS